MSCKWCGNIITHKHPDPAKAKQGITLCDRCGIAHSPNATIPGSFAVMVEGKIVTGIRPTGDNRHEN